MQLGFSIFYTIGKSARDWSNCLSSLVCAERKGQKRVRKARRLGRNQKRSKQSAQKDISYEKLALP